MLEAGLEMLSRLEALKRSIFTGAYLELLYMLRAKMKKEGDAGDAASANFFQLSIFFGVCTKLLQNFAHFFNAFLV